MSPATLLKNTWDGWPRSRVTIVHHWKDILTDSGGYQVFSLSDLRKVREEGVEFRSHFDGALHFLSPETATAAQIALGADVIMAFDECTEYPAGHEHARQSMEMTARWAGTVQEVFSGAPAGSATEQKFEFQVSSFRFWIRRSKLETRNWKLVPGPLRHRPGRHVRRPAAGNPSE